MCGISLLTAHLHTKLLASAVVSVLKLIYMPGTLCADRLERVKCKFAVHRGIAGMLL